MFDWLIEVDSINESKVPSKYFFGTSVFLPCLSVALGIHKHYEMLYLKSFKLVKLWHHLSRCN